MNEWEKKLEDIKGATAVFLASVVCIWVCLEVVRVLFPSFPLKTDSNWIISIIAGLLILLVNYIKIKNKH